MLDPGEFYILASKEKIVIPLDEAAEMAPIAPELGEFRAHYAGFFDPGFGVTHTKGKAVLEVRSRDVPFILEARPACRPPRLRKAHQPAESALRRRRLLLDLSRPGPAAVEVLRSG